MNKTRALPPKFYRVRPEDGWVSATATHPSFLKDPLLSFLQARGRSDVEAKTSVVGDKKGYQDFFMKQGVSFEAEVLSLLRKRIGARSIVKVGNSLDDARSDRKAVETFRHMKKGVPVIYSGVVQNPATKTYGMPDFLVRYDYLKKLVPSVDELSVQYSPKLGKNWYYVAIDVKYATLHLASNGVNLLNSDRYPAYKGQLLVYTLALEYMQGYNPERAYVLGRKWHYVRKGVHYNGSDCLERLGLISYDGYDREYPAKLNEVLEWLAQVNDPQNVDWNYEEYPLSHPNLYPNMNNKYDHPWHELKQEIASRNGEITSLWRMGPHNRDISLEEGICSWKDPSCSAETLGIGEWKAAGTLDQILKVNRSKRTLILPRQLDDPGQEWLERPKLEFYVDFETWNGCLSTSFTQFANTENIIYMVGVLDNKGNYNCFIAERLDKDSERKVLREFACYIRETITHYELSENEVNCVHWSQFEPRMWESATRRHRIANRISWFDLLDVFLLEPITVRNSLTFTLKDIAKAMYGHGMISTTWPEDMDGYDSSVLAQMARDQAAMTENKLYDATEMKQIVEYNRTDVTVLLEMIEYLRERYHKSTKRRRTKK